MQPDQDTQAQLGQQPARPSGGFSLAPGEQHMVQPAQPVQTAPAPAQGMTEAAVPQFGIRPAQGPQLGAQPQPDPVSVSAQADMAGESDYAMMSDEELDEEAAAVEDNVLLAWQNAQQSGQHRPTQWYIVMGVVAAGSIIAAILLQSWFFIPLGILVPIALTKYGAKGTEAHSYELTTYGVVIDGKHYPYDSFKSFFGVENDGVPVFELVPLKRFSILVTLHGTHDVADDIAEILSSVLPESEPEGYLGESIFKRLKF
ncbi:hypothetical protein IT415_03110 [bacterium]|nr:hypothetical protein [bacterium]